MMVESTYHLKSVEAKEGDIGQKPPKEDPTPTVEWSNASCGISTVYGLPSPETFVSMVVLRKGLGFRKQREAFILFSDLASYSHQSNGECIAEYLKNRPEWGAILESPLRKNPNSGNMIKAWIWSINYANPDLQNLMMTGKYPVHITKPGELFKKA